MIQILKISHSPPSSSSISCHNTAKSSYLQIEEMNKLKNTESESKTRLSSPAHLKPIWRHNMVKEGLESSYLQVKKMNKIKNTKSERFSKPKAPSCNTDASQKKLCLCAPTTHPGSFKCRFHQSTTKSHKSAKSETRVSSSPARLVLGTKYRKNLNHTKRMVAPLLDRDNVRYSNKATESGMLRKYQKQTHSGRVEVLRRRMFTASLDYPDSARLLLLLQQLRMSKSNLFVQLCTK